jgi:arylsulfatase A-like enzyme
MRWEGGWELYNIEADRTELHDLASSMPDRAKRMEAMWQQWAERAYVLPKPAEMPPNLGGTPK